MLRVKKNFAHPREKRKNLAFLREKKRFSVKEKLRATKKEVIVALHLSERIVDFFTTMTRISFLLFRKNSFIIAREKERKKEQIKRTQVRVRVVAAVRELLVVLVQVGR